MIEYEHCPRGERRSISHRRARELPKVREENFTIRQTSFEDIRMEKKHLKKVGKKFKKGIDKGKSL